MLFYIGFNTIFLDMSPQARETKAKNKQTGLHQTKKLLYREGNYIKKKKKPEKKKDNLLNGRKKKKKKYIKNEST